jgi:hypothetical protein
MTKYTESALDSYRLAQVYPPTKTKTELYGITEYKLHRLPWEQVDLDGLWLTAVSADRIYEARVYMKALEMRAEVHRWYCDRPRKLVWEGEYRAMKGLGKSSLDTRLLTLRDQYTQERMSELVHLHQLRHSDYCSEGCKYAVPKTTEEQWDEMVALEFKKEKARQHLAALDI